MRKDEIPLEPELEEILPLPKEIFADYRGRPPVLWEEWERYGRVRKIFEWFRGRDPQWPRGWLY